MLDALYLKPPSSFELANQLAQYLTSSSLADDPMVWVYVAAARGQEYSYRCKAGVPKENLLDVRKSALDAAKRVSVLEKNLNSPARVYLRGMYVPNSGPDNDLTVFYGEEEFDKVILGVDRKQSAAEPAAEEPKP